MKRLTNRVNATTMDRSNKCNVDKLSPAMHDRSDQCNVRTYRIDELSDDGNASGISRGRIKLYNLLFVFRNVVQPTAAGK